MEGRMSEYIVFQIVTTIGLLIPISTLIWNMSKLAAQVRENSKEIAALGTVKEDFIVLKSEHGGVLNQLAELKRSNATILDKLKEMEINLIKSNTELKSTIDAVIRNRER
jgi:hypothetical protein